jgi:hypothetical protein
VALGRRCLGLFRPADPGLSAGGNAGPGYPPFRTTGERRSKLNNDFLDILAALSETEAEFIVVGAHAMAVHGVPRATGDIDIWVRPDSENAKKVWKALIDFGAPVEALGLRQTDLENPGTVFQIGLPPRRVDFLTEIDGLSFDQAWPSRVVEKVGDLEIPFLGREALLRNKKASARAKDLADVVLLERREKD